MANVPPRVAELIETFDRNIETYRSQQYNEAQLRREFIDPFFEELGWDVTNIAGNAQAYKDVIHEDAIKVGSATKAPDYSFRIGGTRKFFLEAKKPSIDIKGDPHPAYQLRRYAWSAKLPLSILTDFEEFAVYDCQTRPKLTDKAGTARIMYLNYKEYVKRWSDIESIFSKDAIYKGSFDKFAVSTKGKRGTTTVDKEFLEEIETWREQLAKIIAHRNRTLTVPQINFAVQRTIDRIIFLRMAEDRGIEHYSQLQAISTGSRTYPRLCELFEKADHKYNSGLFYFQKEPGRPEGPDELTLNLIVDDNPLKYILHNLYYPQCPYEFSVLPPEILGNVYEQFLGKVIHVSPARRVKIEEKPEVKKAGGIYYTPSYIVDYIVKNTVGRLLECHCEERSAESPAPGRNEAISNKLKTKSSKLKTPKQVENLRILDPACGSGSFLLSAYTYLLNYHRDWYVENNPEKYRNKIYQGKGGQWYLTIAEKKKILLDNIFGVDIDSQAVEVTKLSLLLKVLENESQETLRLFHERALPDLGNNIKCGNSLIGPDFFDTLEPKQRTTNNEQRTNLDDLYQKINPFDYKTEFPHIFKSKSPGFDTVIGNPPYVKLHNIDKQSLPYFFSNYDTAEKKCDLYAFFVERALKMILKNKGVLGLITSDTWLNLDSFRNLRKIVSRSNQLVKVVTLRNPFKKVSVSPVIFVVCKGKVNDYNFGVEKLDITSKHVEKQKIIPSDSILHPAYIIDLSITIESSKLLKKIESKSTPLVKLSRLQYGIMTANNKRFITAEAKGECCKPLLAGEDIKRYYINWHGDRYIDYQPREMKKKKTARPGEPERFEQEEKVVFQRYSSTKVIASLDTKKFYTLGTTIISHTTSLYSNRYILGVINSHLLSWWYSRCYTSPTNYIREFEQLPIREIDFDKPDDKAKHDRMVKLVDRMLDLHKRLTKAKVPAEKTRIQRQITATDKQIDKLTYDLYGLTGEEISIIEETNKR